MHTNPYPYLPLYSCPFGFSNRCSQDTAAHNLDTRYKAPRVTNVQVCIPVTVYC